METKTRVSNLPTLPRGKVARGEQVAELSSGLTIMEIDALTGAVDGSNLTDGHARVPLTAEQAVIAGRIAGMFAGAWYRAFPAIESEAHPDHYNLDRDTAKLISSSHKPHHCPGRPARPPRDDHRVRGDRHPRLQLRDRPG